MAGNDLRILISANLNIGKSIGEINTAIGGIEKKVNALKLNIEINDKVLSTLTNFNKQLQKISQTATNTGKIIESALLPDGTKVTRTYFDGMHKGFQQSVDDAKRVKNEIGQTTGSVEKQIKSVQELTTNYTKLANEAKRYNSDGTLKSKTSTYLNDKGNARIINTDDKGTVVNFKDIKNLAEFEKAQKKAQKTLQDLAKTGKHTTEELRKIGQGIKFSTTIHELDNLKNRMTNLKFGTSLKSETENVRQSLKKMYDQGLVTESFFKNFNKVINSTKNVSEINKVKEALQRVSDASKNKNLQQNLLSQAQTLLAGNSKKLDTDGVNNLIASLKNLRPSASSAANELTRLRTQLNEYQANSRVAAAHTLTFGSALRQALAGFSLWALTAQMVYAPVRALQDMTQRLIEIDTLMVDIRRVMEMPDFKFTELLGEAVNMSDELSSKLTDVLKIMGDFGRMGFEEGQLLDITKTAQVLQNISDLDAKSSVDTLTSAMLNFNIAAKDSIIIADQLNEVKISSLPLQ